MHPFLTDTLLPALTRYHGIDWAALTLGLSGSYLIGNKNRFGFLLSASGQICWLTFAILSGTLAGILGNALFFSIALRNYRKWHLEDQRHREAAAVMQIEA